MINKNNIVKKNNLINWNEGVVREQTPLWSSLITKSMHEYVLENFHFSFTHKKSVFNTVYISQDEINDFIKLIEEYYRKDKNFFRKIVKRYDFEISRLISNCNKLKKKKFNNFSENVFNEVISISMPVFAQTVPLGYCIDPHIQKKILVLLKNELGDKADEYLRNLSTPSKKNISTKAEEAIMNFAVEGGDILKNSVSLADKYGWLNLRHFKGECFAPKYYEKRLREFISKGAKNIFTDYKIRQHNLRNEASKTLSQIDNQELIEIVKILQDFIYIRTAKKDALTYYGFCIIPMLDAINKKLGISDAAYFTYWEIFYALKNNKKLDNSVTIRRKQGYHDFFKNGKLVIFNRDDYKMLLEETKIENVNEFKGNITCKGKAMGPVAIINLKEDLKKIKEGDILVATMTTPEFMGALKKSIGIITNEGGITCHAAIISRELGMPCIVGTKIATKVLKDGDLVEVDADRGVVKIIKSVKR